MRSLQAACDTVIVAEGPVGDLRSDAAESVWPTGCVVIRGKWNSDAAKRTAMLHRAQRFPGCKWGVILDGDELLVNGENLPEYFPALAPEAMGFSLHLMEFDGSCSYIPNRVLRLDKIKEWTLSSYSFMLKTGVIVQRGNVPVLRGGEPEPPADLPAGPGMFERNPQAWVDLGDGIRQRRRPLAGEPHILHRSVLRSPARQQLRRLNEVEAETVAGVDAVRQALRR